MGKNKDENETLIRYCWPEDVWFHVDDHSSAHVYLRLKPGQSVNEIPDEVLNECCQLVKANSIKACKLDNVTIIYTSFTNLRKEKHMVAGEVGFQNEKLVYKRKVSTKDGPLLRKLEKTKVEKFPDLRQMKEDRDEDERRMKEQTAKDLKKLEHKKKKEEKVNAIKEKEQREYKELFANAPDTKDEMKKMTVAQYEEEEFW